MTSPIDSEKLRQVRTFAAAGVKVTTDLMATVEPRCADWWHLETVRTHFQQVAACVTASWGEL
jgi:hypothetical protein